MEKATEEGMNGKTQSTNQKGYKAYPLILLRMGDYLLHHGAVDGGEPRVRKGGLRRRLVPGVGEPVQLAAHHR